MQKILFLVLFSILFQSSFSQTDMSIVIPYDSVEIQMDKHISNIYNIKLSIISKDKRFYQDSYTFQVINSKSFEDLSFTDLKEVVDFDTLKNKLSMVELKKMKPCEVHEIFSLNNYSKTINIYLFKTEEGVDYFWKMAYIGTSKDVVSTKLD